MNLVVREESQALSSEVRADLLERFQRVRAETANLADPLTAEDMQLQSMPDASPTKWHLAHTSWFFETFILKPRLGNFRPFNAEYHHLFNSYYNSLGTPFSRPQRGLLSRPSVEEIFNYRQAVDEQIAMLLHSSDINDSDEELASLLTLGLNHEQQHQELILTDIKHAFSINPTLPAYTDEPVELTDSGAAHPLRWLDVVDGVYTFGSEGEAFYFDTEGPAHQQYLQDFQIASRLVTNQEYLEFIESGGYQESRLWLSDGWAWVQQHNRKCPLYWQQRAGQWQQFTLAGLQPLQPNEPVSHLSFYEADAFASWAGKRLPTEQEWEAAAYQYRKPDSLAAANLLEKRNYQPLPAAPEQLQFLGDLWEWTASAYLPYPGYRASADAVGEYNGKFMCNQMVLRGGSCITPSNHIRISYRNFFQPFQGWQFSGIRLAGD